jgi:hypothetical protein
MIERFELELPGAPGGRRRSGRADSQTLGGQMSGSAQETGIRSFEVEMRSGLDDLRRRITATRWPEREIVGDELAGCAAGATCAS